MQPAALSVEPLIILSALIFLFVILPLANWLVLKARPATRAIAVSVGLILIVGVSFNLGRMTGLSMAWYHWKSEYKEPLLDWQIELADLLKAGDSNAIIKSVRRFGEENVNAYGREKLFTEGKFREFVEEQKTLHQSR